MSDYIYLWTCRQIIIIITIINIAYYRQWKNKDDLKSSRAVLIQKEVYTDYLDHAGGMKWQRDEDNKFGRGYASMNGQTETD